MMQIRKARPKDAERLCQLGNDFLQSIEKNSPLMKLEKLQMSKSNISAWKKGIDKPPKNFFTFVATIGVEVIGYMELMIKDNEPKKFFKVKQFGWIEAIMVDKKYQKQQVGIQLYQYAMDFLKKKKMQYVRLSVFIKNTIGHQFWMKNGFKEESVEMIRKL